MRRRFDAHLTDETPFPVENVNFADPYDIFDDFKSFKGCCICVSQPIVYLHLQFYV